MLPIAYICIAYDRFRIFSFRQNVTVSVHLRKHPLVCTFNAPLDVVFRLHFKAKICT